TSSHIPGAVNIPLHELLTRMEEIPAGKLWIHCGSGYRSGVGASLLQRADKDVVHIDAMFGQAGKASVPLES
ncbi:rhodanese-like domain-containing protein, partial [Arthrobacter sp. H5]|uniref:rhodanese-like domain-containing protein n=1 Tax=Arthrobacter sp. H5 TaxID=1267973 RepID=UPI000564815D